MTKKYATATAFRMALEERLKTHSRNRGVDLQKLRTQVAFDCLLSRFFELLPNDLRLKGGYAMELRFKGSRITKDIDLIVKEKWVRFHNDSNQNLRQVLQDAVTSKIYPDFFIFLIGTPKLNLEAPPHGGYRYPVVAQLDGRLFVQFPIDIVTTSLIIDPVEHLESKNFLKFAGIKNKPFPCISKAQQFAEKLHAYTFPREESDKSRVKDLIDLILLIGLEKLEKKHLKMAITKVFEYRDTHPIPQKLDPPPANWEPKFNKLAKECGIQKNTSEAFELLSAFVRKIYHQ
ncbi:MAG: hypothetical protein A3G32_09965 [Deltaproteobacteria bacterium RIFCSPLOWO2_12_FULL_40_28]|nr:MAG: hypothetical protein A3C45_04975 [Deltaproteobacteria bacterium RIFCSPHIGHO2_02_FULL_40_28]OGQ20357.1 MAG: hypothetical protein A3E27_00355 [Deltaproteobacteria bacterium RIFCSPHIGHO2_12_FULL_40_32]OGQ41326.1 MAG: hypothetical protein A3I69_02005 [Deltaproteobacteria bacterium RIFCSPLOWO2_02_FULL_40_36]OGQ54965.1 MAG: hypothetical protein A3G32_09965 [Deltaproteobacteria bacterium RIFCSPLOWO2_12_FULL_40_28]